VEREGTDNGVHNQVDVEIHGEMKDEKQSDLQRIRGLIEGAIE